MSRPNNRRFLTRAVADPAATVRSYDGGGWVNRTRCWITYGPNEHRKIHSRKPWYVPNGHRLMEFRLLAVEVPVEPAGRTRSERRAEIMHTPYDDDDPPICTRCRHVLISPEGGRQDEAGDWTCRACRSPEDTSDRIWSLADLCAYFSAETPAQLNRRIYKGTDCGASLSVYSHTVGWIHNGDLRWRDLPITFGIDGFTIQTIVEGSDSEVNSDTFWLPATHEEIQHWISDMEDEADRLWHEANDEEED